MPVPLTYPGVYIEEIPSGVRTITGVSTSVTAFVGFTPKGTVNKALKIYNFGEFEREFGELSNDNELGYAVRQFFFNGGSEAWIVRVASGAVKASVDLKKGTGTGPDDTGVLKARARSEGSWGNYLKMDVDYETTNPDSTFNLTIYEYRPRGTEIVLGGTETFRNLSMDRRSPRYVVDVVKSGSKLIEILRHDDLTDAIITNLDEGWSQSGDLSGLLLPGGLDESKRFISIIVDGEGPHEVDIFKNGQRPENLDNLKVGIEEGVRNADPAKFSSFEVFRVNADGTESATGNHLRLRSGSKAERSSVRVLNASSNSASRILKLGLVNGGRERDAVASIRPVPTGTSSRNPAAFSFPLPSGDLKIDFKDDVTVVDSLTLNFEDVIPSMADLLKRLRDGIKEKLKDHPVFRETVISEHGLGIRAVSGRDTSDLTLSFSSEPLALALALNIDGDSLVNVQKYSLGAGATRAAQESARAGAEGNLPGASEIQGDILEKTGIYALEDADIFNILCIPLTADLTETSALAVISEAVRYCETKRAFMIVDPPRSASTVSDAKGWMEKLPQSSHAAHYFPSVVVPDPVVESRPMPFPPSGTIAGLYARTDSSRGVWKAPAGIDASLNNVQGFIYNLTDGENGDLNKMGINCLRAFPVYGRVSWGARTLKGADKLANEYKYIPIRRLALYIEESLFRGLKWVVFEPNDEPLWAQIRLNVGAFMHDLFRQGAFQGITPREAYLVKCDKETTTQSDINNGIVNILVGFAPLKPAEFVVIKIQQMAGQIQT